MPIKENLLAGREASDLEDYCFVCYFFTRRVIGCSRFDQHLETGGDFSAIATGSDEAFALSVLANNYDKWSFKCRGEPPKQGEEIPVARFTNGYGKRAKRYQGWNLEGLTFYGELESKFNDMRENDDDAPALKEFDATFAEYWRKITGREANPSLEAYNSVESQAERLAERFKAKFPKNRKPLQRHA